LVGGAIARAAGDLQQRPGRTTRSLLWAYVWNWRFVLMIGAGAAAGVVAYIKLFESNPTFDGSMGALWPLAGATFTATVTAKTVADLRKPSEKDVEEGLAQPGAERPQR